MNKEISFFDLDGTLWNLNNDIYIIDKEKPHKHLLKISRYEYALIKGGFYTKDGIKLDYNGRKYYISKDMFEVLKSKSNTENEERFGVSFINFSNRENLNQSDLKYLLHNILHLSKNTMDVGLLTARFDQRNHADLLNNLRLELKDINIDINKIYFVSDTIYSKTPYFQAMGKLYVLLEHLIGLKIKDGMFTDEEQDMYDTVYFYDDDIKNIDFANSIMFYLSGMLYKSNDEIHKKVSERIQNNNLVLKNYLVTHNKMNPFKETIIKISQPAKYPIFTDSKVVESRYIKPYVKFLGE